MCQVDLPSARMAHPEKAAHRLLCRPMYANKADAMCKDLVNAPRKAEAVQEGVASVSFLGAGGKEITVECPKVCKGHSCHIFCFWNHPRSFQKCKQESPVWDYLPFY